MDEHSGNTDRLLEEIGTQLRHIKWILIGGLIVVVLLLLTVIVSVFFPVLVGLILAAFLIVGPAAYLYYIFVASVQRWENRLRVAENNSESLLTKATR